MGMGPRGPIPNRSANRGLTLAPPSLASLLPLNPVPAGCPADSAHARSPAHGRALPGRAIRLALNDRFGLARSVHSGRFAIQCSVSSALSDLFLDWPSGTPLSRVGTGLPRENRCKKQASTTRSKEIRCGGRLIAAFKRLREFTRRQKRRNPMCQHRGCHCEETPVSRAEKGFCSEECADRELAHVEEPHCFCGHIDCAAA